MRPFGFVWKPVYQVTMKDVIKETGMSQGGIYRYYANFYDILFALIERESQYNDFRKNVDDLFDWPNTRNGS